MLRNKMKYVSLGIIVLFLLQGCVSKEEAAEELMQYFNEDIRTELSDRYNEKVTKRFDLEEENIEDEIQLHLNEEIIPAAKDFIDYLETLHYESRAVRRLNELDIKINKLFYEAFQDMEKALGEGSTIDEVNREYESQNQKVKKMSEKYFENRDKLIQKYDLESYRDYEGDGKGEQKLRKKNE